MSKIADGIEVMLRWLLVWGRIWMVATLPFLYLEVAVESHPSISSALHYMLIACLLLLACGAVTDIAMRATGRGAIFGPLRTIMRLAIQTPLATKTIGLLRSTASEASEIAEEASSGMKHALTILARTLFLLIRIALAIGLLALILTTPWLWMLIVLILLIIIALR